MNTNDEEQKNLNREAAPNRRREREPWIVQDPQFNREWLCPEPLQFYLHWSEKNNLWYVIDRYTDLYVGKGHILRGRAIRAFYKEVGRDVPEDTKLLPTYSEECKHDN